MPCTPIPGGGFVCSRGTRRCSVPGCAARMAAKLCDYPVKRADRMGRVVAGATCDAALCAAHAVSVGPDRDYCPPHARAGEVPR